MVVERTEATAMPLQVRLGPIARWGVTGVFLLTVVVAGYTLVTPGKQGTTPLVFFGPLVLVLGLGTIAVWRSRLDLGATDVRRRGLLRTRVIRVDDIERVAQTMGPSGSERSHLFVTGHALPVTIDLRYWDRSSELRAYLADLSSRSTERRASRSSHAAPVARLRPDDRTAASETRRALSIQRWSALAMLLVAMGGLAIPSGIAAIRGQAWGVLGLVAAAAVLPLGAWFATSVPRRWLESGRTMRSQAIFFAEVLNSDTFLRDRPTRTGLRADGRLELTRDALEWSARAGAVRFVVELDTIDDLLLGPAGWRRWFLIAHTPAGPARFLVADPTDVAEALRVRGMTVRTLDDG